MPERVEEVDDKKGEGCLWTILMLLGIGFVVVAIQQLMQLSSKKSGPAPSKNKAVPFPSATLRAVPGGTGAQYRPDSSVDSSAYRSQPLHEEEYDDGGDDEPASSTAESPEQSEPASEEPASGASHETDDHGEPERDKKCPDCNGNDDFFGMYGNGTCSSCRGSGESLLSRSAVMLGAHEECHECHGSTKCQTCHGSGRV